MSLLSLDIFANRSQESRGRWSNGLFSTRSDVVKTIKALIKQNAYQALEIMLSTPELVLEGQISDHLCAMMNNRDDWSVALFQKALKSGCFYVPRLAELLAASTLDMSSWAQRENAT
jgi:hypothetical protein